METNKNLEYSDQTNDDWKNIENLTAKDIFEKTGDFLQKLYKYEFIEGQELAIGGKPDFFKEFNHIQGDNHLGFEGTCGLVSCEDVLKQYGINVSEDEIVWHAVENNECIVSLKPELSGGTTAFEQAEILRDYGVDCDVTLCEDVFDLSRVIENNRSAIIGVNAGMLWNDARAFGSGMANHAVVVTGVVRDANDISKLKGFYINDSGSGHSKEFVSKELLEEIWLKRAGGIAVTTINEHK